jgi:taurine dioxygenase
VADDFDIKPTDGPLGAYVERWSSGKELDAEAVRVLREALWTYSVLILRDKKLTEAEQVAFSRMFCDPVPTPSTRATSDPCPKLR